MLALIQKPHRCHNDHSHVARPAIRILMQRCSTSHRLVVILLAYALTDGPESYTLPGQTIDTSIKGVTSGKTHFL